ncbi:hypothetical protein D3C72_1062900 [compost metagenome]
MNPEQGLFREWVQFFIKVQVIFILQFRRWLIPDRVTVIDDIVYSNFFVLWFAFGILTIRYVFGFGTELDSYGQELTVFVQYIFDTLLFQELFRFGINVQGNGGTTLAATAF